MRDILEDVLGGPSVFKDAAKLGYDYVPEDLPGRQDEYRQFALFLKPLLTAPQGQHVMVTGPVGSGKTALARRFLTDFRSVAAKQGTNVEWVHVNCRRRSTDAAALLAVLQHFDERFPDRGFSNPEMLEILRKQLDRRKAQLVVVLDEADILLRKAGSDLVYNLTRFNEEETRAETSVSLVLVSQADARPLLDEAARSTFRRANTLAFDRYDAPRLQAIVHQRVQLAYHAGTFPEELEELVADIAAASAGDARYAIEILHKAGQLADDAGRSRVSAEDVRGAVAESHPFVNESRLKELNAHQRFTLLAVARTLKKGDAYAITGDVEKRYALVCEEFDEKPRAHTQFWTYLKELTDLGLLDTKRSGKGVLGTTTLISLPDVPAAVLEEKLLELQKA